MFSASAGAVTACVEATGASVAFTGAVKASVKAVCSFRWSHFNFYKSCLQLPLEPFQLLQKLFTACVEAIAAFVGAVFGVFGFH